MPEVAKSTHYHDYWVHPNWVGEMKRMYQLGGLIFYRPRAWGDGSDEPSLGRRQDDGRRSQENVGRSHACGCVEPCAAQMACDHDNSFWTGRGNHYVPRPPARSADRAPDDQTAMWPERFDNVGAICNEASRRGRLAHAPGGRDLRLPDRDDQLRAALLARLFPHAAVAGPITGAATSSRWRSPFRICCGASASRLPAPSPTASAPPAS